MLWRAYALLSHGGDRMGIGARIHSWRRPGKPGPSRQPDEVLAILEGVDAAVWSASALAACAESGLLRQLEHPVTVEDLSRTLAMPPALVQSLVDVLQGYGLVTWKDRHVQAAPALLPFTSPDGAITFRAGLRAPLLQSEDFRRRLGSRTLALDGWTHTDEAVIEAQGALTRAWTERAVSKLKFLPGLVARLERRGAALLDVGAGAAGLSIALCRAFPQVSAVALEPAPCPAAIGERHVREAGLEERITIRRQPVEHMEDREAFDLAFLPQMFLPDAVIPETMRRVFAALRPGGWLLVPALAHEGHDVASAVNRLKNLLWGGNTRTLGSLKQRLSAAGFDPVIRAPGGRALRMICARRPIGRVSP
jgi:precorrin-6B methylase 2